MNQNIIIAVLNKYGFRYAKILAPQKGYRNTACPVLLDDGRLVNLIFYKCEPKILSHIQAAHRVSDFLAAHNFPTRRTLGPIIRLHNEKVEKFVAPYNYLPGDTIPWEAYTKEHLKLLGEAMGKMHAQLQQLDCLETLDSKPVHLESVEPVEQVVVTTLYLECIERMKCYFAHPDVRQAMNKKLYITLDLKQFDRFVRLLKYCHILPGQHALHMDFVRGNILYGQKDNKLAITGILDFEKIAFGHPLFDIARTLAFLLVDCKFKPEEKIRKYFLHSGYTKRAAQVWQLTSLHTAKDSSKLLGALVTFFLLYDFYKFLRHNPYEFLPQNEHFIRTSAMLVRRKVIARLDDKMITN